MFSILQATDATDGKLHIYWIGIVVVIIVALIIYLIRRKSGQGGP